jgi:hypothetical protein
MIEKTDKFAQSVTSETLREVYGVWTALAAGRIGPQRAELTPAKLRRTTAWTFTVDVIDGGKDFRVGFRGDKVIQFLGENCTAPSLASLRGIHFFDVAEELFRQCVLSARPLVSGPKRTQYKGKEHLEREVILLPLSEDGVTVTGILGAFATWQLGTHPHTEVHVVSDRT